MNTVEVQIQPANSFNVSEPKRVFKIVNSLLNEKIAQSKKKERSFVKKIDRIRESRTFLVERKKRLQAIYASYVTNGKFTAEELHELETYKQKLGF